MKTYTATVLARRHLSAHLVTVTLGDLKDYASTGLPDEYLRILIPTASATGTDLRVYTISDYRLVDSLVQVDLDIALHDQGVGSHWALSCQRGDVVEVTGAHGLYSAPADVGWQLLVADITGIPALARILRGLSSQQRASVHLVLTDADDQIALPSAAEVDITWQIVGSEADISQALTDAVTSRTIPASDRYVWLAGEARASRAVRRHLRRELGWSQTDFCTCGYWQIDAHVQAARYREVAAEVEARTARLRLQLGDDPAAYRDALEDMYESVGL